MSDKITKYGDIGTPERHARRELLSKKMKGQLREALTNVAKVYGYC